MMDGSSLISQVLRNQPCMYSKHPALQSSQGASSQSPFLLFLFLVILLLRHM